MATFEQWVDFTFGLTNGPSLLNSVDQPWSTSELLEHCLRFFRTATQVLRRVPQENGEKALWQLPGIDGYLGILARTELPLERRIELAKAHVELFESGFSDRFPNAAFMWWEQLPGAEYEPSGTPFKQWSNQSVGRDLVICQCIWDSLQKILYMPRESSQKSALHGLNEMASPAKSAYENIIERFLESPIEKSASVIEYAREVQSGHAM
jgi:hypothetical protein